MRVRIVRDDRGVIYPILPVTTARRKFKKFKGSLKFNLLAALFSSFFSPFLSGVFLLLAYKKIKEFNDTFFANETVRSEYELSFAPVTSEKLYSIVGYRVYPEEWTAHKKVLENVEELAKKGERMKKIPERQVGFDKNVLTRHFLFIGTTGAGKTETVMSLLEDVIRSGGGAMMLDGKSDQGMEYKFYTLLKKHKYETQFNTIVLNKPEERPETNTYNPLIAYTSAFKLSEFLGDLLGGDGGDGNAEYFKNRGKVMLSNVITFFKFREKLYKEKSTFNDLKLSIGITELNNLFYLGYSIALETEEVIKQKTKDNPAFSRHIKAALKEKTPQFVEIQHIEILVAYLNRYPQYMKEIESLLGLSVEFLQTLYDYVVSMFTYATGIKEEWGKYLKAIGHAVYLAFKKEGKNLLYTQSGFANVQDVRETYKRLKEDTSYLNGIIKTMNKTEKITVLEGLGVEESESTAENLPQDAVQQHNYAIQQWDRLFSMLKQYSHVLDTPTPDVDGIDVFKNNKFLYVMLPVLEYSPDATMMLGKIFVLMFKAMAATALGGEKQDALPLQFAIYQNKIKPNPLYLAIFDEYGAYPVPKAMPMLLAQIRSLNCSALLSIQDLASTQPLKTDEWELERQMANSSKIVLEARDGKLWETAVKYIPEYEYIKPKYVKDALSDKFLLVNNEVDIEKAKPFEETITKEFKTGMGMLVTGTREPVLFQSYYRGGDEKKLIITNLTDFYKTFDGI